MCAGLFGKGDKHPGTPGPVSYHMIVRLRYAQSVQEFQNVIPRVETITSDHLR